MLPYIVITAAIIFFLLQRSGLFEDLRSRQNDRPRDRKRWGRRMLRELEQDPDTAERLEVFKDFLDSQADDEE